MKKPHSPPLRSPTRFKRWFEHEIAPAARAYPRGALWRDTTPKLQAQFAHYALVMQGETHSMDLNLNEHIEKLALFKGAGAKRFLTKRLSYHLRAALGRTAQFWFVLEETENPTRRLHLHGAIGCTRSEAKAVRKALRQAGGEFRIHARRYQANLTYDPDDGAVSYALKEPLKLTKTVRNMSSTASWADDPFMVTRLLKSRAKSLYEGARGSVPLIW